MLRVVKKKRKTNMSNQEVLQRLDAVKTALDTQTVSQVVSTFSGDPKKFQGWLKEVEKFAVLSQLPEENKRLVAYQTSSGVVSDFIARFLSTAANPTWDELKQHLTSRFGEIKDAQHALALLARLRQKRDESVPMFAERVHTLAADAFPGVQRQAAVVERQLVGYFLDGLTKETLKMKVLRADPRTLEEAVDVAAREDILQEKFALRLADARQYRATNQRPQDEPMEVDRAQTRRCFRCGKAGHRAKDCFARSVNEVRPGSSVNQQVGGPPRRGKAPMGQCWRCGQVGHFRRECPN